MQATKDRQRNWRGILLAGFAFIGMAFVLPTSPAQAIQLYDGSVWQAQLDTTVSYGLMWRVEKRDKGIIGIGNGGKKSSPNFDDGNLNYSTGLVSNQAKIISELDLASEFGGLFLRGRAFYDFETMDGNRSRTDLLSDAEDQSGRSIDLLDAYVWGQKDLGPVPVQVRVGEQVVSWGESTFIQGGINVLNPVDLSALRSPGAELKEALLPEGLVWANAGLTENISVEGVYFYDWGKIELDPLGTYFSEVDFLGDEAFKVVLGNGTFPDMGNASVADTFLGLPRSDDYKPKDDGQYGAALRWYVPALSGTEFGFFFLNYHNRLPVLSAKTGTLPGLINAGAAAGAVYAAAGVGPGMNPAVDAAAQGMALNEYLKTAAYRAEYVEDIKLYGVSFATELFGVAFQGEYSFRPDAPLQIDDVELLLSALGPLNPALGGLSQLGAATELDHDFKGYIERDMSQVQMTATHLLGPTLGADEMVVLGEVGLVHVHNMPSTSTLRLEGPGAVKPGSDAAAAALGFPSKESSDKFADATSWGYRLLVQMDFNNAIGAISLKPRVAWSHDVDGISPLGGPFQEDRKAITLGLGGTYLDAWSADVSYTSFFGAGDYNMINDRDFIAANIKYSF